MTPAQAYALIAKAPAQHVTGGNHTLSVAEVHSEADIRRVASFVAAIDDPETDASDEILATLVPDEDDRADLVYELSDLTEAANTRAGEARDGALWDQVDPVELRRCTKEISDAMAASQAGKDAT